MTTHLVALVNITDGSVQGHKAGCADLKRGNLRRHADDSWEVEVETKAEARAIYNGDFDYDTDGWYGIEWAPCAKHVPAGIEPEDVAAVDKAVRLSTPAGAFEAAVATAKVRRTWTVTSPDATHTCAGACGETKPLKAFPTTKVNGERGVECRKCRDARVAGA